MFFNELENRLFEARLRAKFPIFPLKNISIQLFARLPAKLAYAEEFIGDTERKTGAYLDVREDLSTGSTNKLPAEVELCRKFTIAPSFYRRRYEPATVVHQYLFLVILQTLTHSNQPAMIQKEQVVQAIKQVYDPEIPVDIYELGLIYEITILPLNNIEILMTLTSPNCPAADLIPSQVEEKVKAIEGVNEVKVDITFEPPYTTERMSETAKLELGFA